MSVVFGVIGAVFLVVGVVMVAIELAKLLCMIPPAVLDHIGVIIPGAVLAVGGYLVVLAVVTG